MKKLEPHRGFFESLIWEKDGSMNLSQLLCTLLTLIGATGFIYAVILNNGTIVEKIVAWSFLTGSFASLLIASLPINKAKILASATLPSDLEHGLADVVNSLGNPLSSSDIQELTTKKG